jgi:hypothetical protein
MVAGMSSSPSSPQQKKAARPISDQQEISNPTGREGRHEGVRKHRPRSAFAQADGRELGGAAWNEQKLYGCVLTP